VQIIICENICFVYCVININFDYHVKLLIKKSYLN